MLSVADPDFELRRGPGVILLAQPAFLPAVIPSFFTQNKGEVRTPWAPPLDPTLVVIMWGPQTRIEKSFSYSISYSYSNLKYPIASFRMRCGHQ